MFAFAEGYILRHELFPVFTIVIGPALYRWDITRPVAVTRLDGRRPLQCIGTPWILGRHFATAENGIEEVDDEECLQEKYHNSRHRNELVQRAEVAESIKRSAGIVIATGYARQTHVVHRPENSICSEDRAPEVDLTQGFIHEAAEHLREPVINAREHPKEGRNTHHNVEVGHNKISVVHLDVNSGVTQEDTGQTTGNEHGHEPDGKQTGRIETEIRGIYRSDPVEHLYSRRHGNNQGKDYEEVTYKRVHPGHEHVVRPNDK